MIGPKTQIGIPASTVLTDPDYDSNNARIEAGTEFAWPIYENDEMKVDLRQVPDHDAQVHDLYALTGLAEGKYRVSNSQHNLEATVSFDNGLFEYIWYWGFFGGFDDAPFFG